MERDWRDLTYLLQGTSRQQAAYNVLQAIVPKLSSFDPILTGTIPLNIDIPTSDLDIICHAPEIDAFKQILLANFGHLNLFSLKKQIVDELPTIIVRFEYNHFTLEIFGQPRPVTQQTAFRHLIVEARLLQYGVQSRGETIRQQIHQLKQNGIKTEPAFAIAFNLTGDPYQTLWQLSYLSPEELYQTIFNKT